MISGIARRAVQGLAAGLLAALTGVRPGPTAAGSTFERGLGLPWLFSVRRPIEPPREVAVAAIDGRTGEPPGLPPPRDGSRTMDAQSIDERVRRGARPVVFGMPFDQPVQVKAVLSSDRPGRVYRSRCQAWAAGATPPDNPYEMRMDVK